MAVESRHRSMGNFNLWRGGVPQAWIGGGTAGALIEPHTPVVGEVLVPGRAVVLNGTTYVNQSAGNITIPPVITHANMLVIGLTEIIDDLFNSVVDLTGPAPLGAEMGINRITGALFYVDSAGNWQPLAAGGGLNINPVQTVDFTATAGASGLVQEWPVDMSAMTPGSILNVTQPVGPHTTGDTFAVEDISLACTLTRIIRVNFTTPIHGLAPPDYAVINNAGARLEFSYIDATYGWRIQSSVNF